MCPILVPRTSASGPERVKTLSYLASVNQALLAESISQVFAPTGTGNAPERL